MGKFVIYKAAKSRVQHADPLVILYVLKDRGKFREIEATNSGEAATIIEQAGWRIDPKRHQIEGVEGSWKELVCEVTPWIGRLAKRSLFDAVNGRVEGEEGVERVPAALVDKEYNEWADVVFPEALYVKVVPENQPGEEAAGYNLLDVSRPGPERKMDFGNAGGTWNADFTEFTPAAGGGGGKSSKKKGKSSKKKRKPTKRRRRKPTKRRRR